MKNDEGIIKCCIINEDTKKFYTKIKTCSRLLLLSSFLGMCVSLFAMFLLKENGELKAEIITLKIKLDKKESFNYDVETLKNMQNFRLEYPLLPKKLIIHE